MNVRSYALLEVTVRLDGARVVVAVDGELCLLTAASLEAVLDGLDALEGARVVEVDLSGVTLLAVAGLEVLERAGAVLRARGYDLVVPGATGLVREVIERLGAEWLLAPTAA